MHGLSIKARADFVRKETEQRRLKRNRWEKLKRKLPLRITVKIDATNLSTLLYGLEAVCEPFRRFQSPKKGQIFKSKFFQAEILDTIYSLNDPRLKFRATINKRKSLCK